MALAFVSNNGLRLIWSCVVAGSTTAKGKRRLVSAKKVVVVFMKLQNNRDSAWRAITKFNWQLDRYEPSSPTTKELRGCGIQAV